MTKTKYAYHYTDAAGNPLARCPACAADLTDVRGGGVFTEFVTDAGLRWWVGARLDRDGKLEDPTGDVEDGRHSQTNCRACDFRLIDDEGVNEEQTRFALKD